MKSHTRVMYIFTSSRDLLIDKWKLGFEADTALRGLNYISGAEYLTIPPQSFRALRHIPRLLKYDAVIAQDNLLLGYLVSCLALLLKKKTRWIYMAINSSTIMRRYEKYPIKLFFLKKFWNSYARIVCLSSGQAKDFIRIGINRSRIVVIPFGVDVDFFDDVDKDEEDGEYVVSVGRDAGRDYVNLFDAAERVGFPLVVVTSPKNITPHMRIPSNVSILYDKSLVDIRDIYHHARFVVVSSKDVSSTENGSDCSGQTVILDAMSSKKAVIATRRQWIEDYFDIDRDIILVEPNDPIALAVEMTRLWNNKNDRTKISCSGYQKVFKNYNTKTMAHNLLNIINHLT